MVKNKCNIDELENKLREIHENRANCIYERLIEINKKRHKFQIYTDYPLTIYGDHFTISDDLYIHVYVCNKEVTTISLKAIRYVQDITEYEKALHKKRY